ncbi:MAG: glycosyltransferase family 2 protein [Candidatus Zixiibacteriota bacterium]
MPDINPQKTVSAIVVTFNSAEGIESCLKALSTEIASVGGDIIVYDNGSHDSTIRAVETGFPHIHLYRSSRNIGFGAGCNQAVAKSESEYILFANPDLIIDTGALAVLIETMSKLPDAGAVAARMRHPDGSFQPTCRKLPTSNNIFFSRGSIFGGRSEKNGYTLDDFGATAEVPAAAATCLLMRRDFFLSLGGFDERFFVFMEDTDLCMRIAAAGKKVYFEPRAGGIHHWGKGSSVSSFKRQWYHHMSVWKYFLKHYPNGFSLLLLPAALLVNLLLKTVTGRIRS